MTPGVPKFGLLGGDGQIAGGDELASGGGGDAMDARNHRLRDCLDGVHQLGAEVEDGAIAVDVAIHQLAQVVSGGECRAVGRQHDGAHVGFGAEFAQGVDQFAHHLAGERVAFLWAVHGDRGDGRVTLDEDGVVRHCKCSLRILWSALTVVLHVLRLAWLARALFLLERGGDGGGDDAIQIAIETRHLFEQRGADEQIAQVGDNHQRLDLWRELAIHERLLKF